MRRGSCSFPPIRPLGEPIAQVLGLDDYVLELDLTPNRGDCLSMVGVAREVAALTGAKLRLPEIPAGASDAVSDEEEIRVTVADPDLCPRYTVRLLTDIKIGPSPSGCSSGCGRRGCVPSITWSMLPTM